MMKILEIYVLSPVNDFTSFYVNFTSFNHLNALNVLKVILFPSYIRHAIEMNQSKKNEYTSS